MIGQLWVHNLGAHYPLPVIGSGGSTDRGELHYVYSGAAQLSSARTALPEFGGWYVTPITPVRVAASPLHHAVYSPRIM